MEKRKDMIKKYPWIEYENGGTIFDEIPFGWHNIVKDMCEEIQSVLEKYHLVEFYHVIEAKEKWHMLRWYDYIDDFQSMPQEIVRIVCDYEELSKSICMICGEPKDKHQKVCDMCESIYGI